MAIFILDSCCQVPKPFLNNERIKKLLADNVFVDLITNFMFFDFRVDEGVFKLCG